MLAIDLNKLRRTRIAAPRIAIAVLTLLHMLLFILLIVLAKPGEDIGFYGLNYSRLGIFSGQGFLLGLWAALGGKPAPWRAMFVVMVATLAPIEGAGLFLLGQALFAMGVLLLSRFMGLGLSKDKVATEDREGHLQFSLKQALIWMTAFAVFMAATHYFDEYSFGPYFEMRNLYFPASCFAVGLATTWLVCGRRWIFLRFFTLLAMIGPGTRWLVRVRPLDLSWGQGAELLGCVAAVTAASLGVVRLAGYRLVWHSPFPRSKREA